MVNLKRKHEDEDDDDVINFDKKIKIFNDKVTDFLFEKLDDKSKKSIDVLKELQFLFKANSYCYHILNFAIACCERNLFKINDTQYSIENVDDTLEPIFLDKEDLQDYHLKIKFNYELNEIKEDCYCSFDFNDGEESMTNIMYFLDNVDVDDDKKPDARIDFNSFCEKLWEEKILVNNLISQ